MEKLVYLVPAHPEKDSATLLAHHLTRLAAHTCHLTLLTPTSADAGELGISGALCLWLPCLDRRVAFEAVLRELVPSVDGYLVTESVLREGRGPVAQHADVTLVLLRQAPKLGQAELRERLAQVSPALAELAVSERIVRDSVVRPLDARAPALRAMFTFVHGAAPEREATLLALCAVTAPFAEHGLAIASRCSLTTPARSKLAAP